MNLPKPSFRRRSVFFRYAGLISSTVIFLVLISVILAVTIYSANSVNKKRAQSITITQTSQMFSRFIHKATILKSGVEKDPKFDQPPLADELETLHNAINNAINALEKGGPFKPLDRPEQTLTPIVAEQELPHLTTLVAEWGKVSSTFKYYIDTYKRNLDASGALKDFLTTLDITEDVIIDAIDGVDRGVRQISRGHSDFSNKVSITGISAAIIYFAIFTLYFLRRLIVADTQARVSREQTRDIMHTVNEGLFLLDEQLVISDEYSNELENILGVKTIARRKLSNVLGALISEKDLETAGDFIEQLFNRVVLEELITELNPLDRVRFFINDPKTGHKNEKYLSFKFKRVYEDDIIKRVLVSVSDITQSVKLEKQLAQQHKRNEEQIELLSSILHVDATSMKQFVNNVQRASTSINTILKSPQRSKASLMSKINFIAREVHSLKGEASAIGLGSYISLLEDFEDRLVELKNQEDLTGEEFLTTAIHLERLINLTENVSTLFERLETGSLRALASQITAGNSGGSGDAENPFNSDYFNNFAQEIAARNSNKAVAVEIEGFENVDIAQNKINILKDMSLQLLRNAIVHGIETPEQRQSVGKEATGHISIRLIEHDAEDFSYVFTDDGNGIDFKTLEEKANNDGWLTKNKISKPTQNDLVRYMFSSGSSTMAKHSEDAGRGVGLDVIKDRVKQLSGKIVVSSVSGEHTTFKIIFPGV